MNASTKIKIMVGKLIMKVLQHKEIVFTIIV